MMPAGKATARVVSYGHQFDCSGDSYRQQRPECIIDEDKGSYSEHGHPEYFIACRLLCAGNVVNHTS
jgi:hypothetical protein